MTVTEFVNWTRKAWLAAIAVATALTTASGVPTDVKAWAVTVVAVLGTFGVVFKVENEPATEAKP